MPHLVEDVGGEPIRVLLQPSLREDGSVTGLQEEFHEGALLVGRVPGMASLARVLGSRSHPRMAALDSLLGPVRPACLDLSWIPQISRAHFLITRDARGLLVHLLPDVQLDLHAGGLASTTDTLSSVVPGRPVSVGRAGEIQVIDPERTEPFVRLFVFAGDVAFHQYAARAAARKAGRLAPLEPSTLHKPAETTLPAGERVQVWSLSGPERKALNAIVLTFEGGDFKAHLLRQLEPRAADPGYWRLARYLLGARPTQYCARLYAHPDNGALRTELAEALRTRGDRDVPECYPVGIRRAVAGLLDA